MGWAGLLGFIVLAIAAAPYLAERLRPRPSRRERSESAGQDLPLTDGRTHYTWYGPVDGEVLVCIHGLTTPCFVWDGLRRDLTAMGYRVLTYDLYGRGLSDVVKAPHTRSLFLRQLNELLDCLGVETCSLLGFSMGGQIAMAMAAEAPARVERLMLIAPTGFGYAPSEAEAFMRDAGQLGAWLHLGLAGGLMRRGLRPLAGVQTSVPDLVKRQRRQIGRRGFSRAVLSSQRHFLRDQAASDVVEAMNVHIPTLAIWGERDAIIPAEARDRLALANRDAHQVTIPGASHWLPVTHPHEVSAAISSFRRSL